MINLLTPEQKNNLRAARRNVTLRRYIISLVVTLVLAAAAFAAGYILMVIKNDTAQAEKQSNQRILDEHKSVADEAVEFSDNLKKTKAILGSEVLFSTLLADIANTLPRGSVFTNLNITTEDIGGDPIILSARTVDSGKTPLKLKNDLEASSLFENVSIDSITRNPPGDNDSEIAKKYPVVVTLTATVSKEAGARGENQ